MVVVPYPHAAGHQRRNAEELVGAGAATLIEDQAFNAQALLAAAAMLDKPSERAAIGAAARSLARPGAADAAAELVMAAAERRPFPDPARIEAISRGVAS
jgi:UDP-N-acetylglucosamine:LPS N-acetylglucosamine transferase